MLCVSHSPKVTLVVLHKRTHTNPFSEYSSLHRVYELNIFCNLLFQQRSDFLLRRDRNVYFNLSSCTQWNKLQDDLVCGTNSVRNNKIQS